MRKVFVWDTRGSIAGKRPADCEVDLRDDGIYVHRWPDGYTSTTFCSNPKFDVLLDNAAYAFVEGNTRDTVLTAASAIDAYLDYHIEVVMLSKGHCQASVDYLLKMISSQAERRIGAFLGIESVLQGKEIPFLSNKLVELRNKVAHRGYIPTKEEAKKYLCGVLDFILPFYHPLYANHLKIINGIFFKKVGPYPVPEGSLIGHGTFGMRTVATTLMYPTFKTSVAIDGYLDEIRQRHKKF